MINFENLMNAFRNLKPVSNPNYAVVLIFQSGEYIKY